MVDPVDETYRRTVTRQLNMGEGRHSLARKIFHGHRGDIMQAYRAGQEVPLGALGLVLNAVVLANAAAYPGPGALPDRQLHGDLREDGVPGLGLPPRPGAALLVSGGLDDPVGQRRVDVGLVGELEQPVLHNGQAPQARVQEAEYRGAPVGAAPLCGRRAEVRIGRVDEPGAVRCAAAYSDAYSGYAGGGGLFSSAIG